jgi:hypothetical protein
MITFSAPDGTVFFAQHPDSALVEIPDDLIPDEDEDFTLAEKTEAERSEIAKRAWDVRGRKEKEKAGKETEEAAPTVEKQPKNPKVARAIKSHKPATKEKQQWAERNETVILGLLGGNSMTTGDNKPTDVNMNVGEKLHGVEVKTFLDNKNSKVTMHKDSRERKLAWAKKNRAKLHTIVVDDRDRFKAKTGKGSGNYSGHRLYYREGVGSFTLDSMIKVESPKHLKELMGI